MSSRYEMSDGMIVDTGNASRNWDEDTRFDGRNHISIATGSQWDHETLYRSRRGRYYIESVSQWQGSTPTAEWVSNEEAARWLLKMEHELPADLKDLAEDLID
jgi:hypothetical protein